jgi:chitosanase
MTSLLIRNCCREQYGLPSEHIPNYEKKKKQTDAEDAEPRNTNNSNPIKQFSARPFARKWLAILALAAILVSVPLLILPHVFERSGNNTLLMKPPQASDLYDPAKKEIAMQLVSSAENSSTDWRAQYAYIEDIGDNRGYTAGIIGFTSGTGDMLKVVQYYILLRPDNNVLAKYVPALQKVVGTPLHDGLDPTFVVDWKTAANDPLFHQAQDHIRDEMYFDPAVTKAKSDGLGPLGQFIYFDAIVMHGPGNGPNSFSGIRAAALTNARPPSQGGDEVVYLKAFLDARKASMLTDPDRFDTSRIDTEQRLFLEQGNLGLNLPLNWQTYGDHFSILK